MECKDRRIENSRLDNIEDLLKSIFGVLNGPKGLVTKVELHSQQLNNVPSPSTIKWYAFIGGGVVTLFGIIGYSIKVIFKGE